MSVEKDKDATGGPATSASSQAKTQQKPQPKKKKGPSDEEVGGALRSIYQRTVDERIPPDLLDLLGKLG